MKKLLYILSLSIILITGCEKDLDLYPLGELSEDIFFKSEKDFKLFANQFYAYLPNFDLCNRDNDADIAYNSSAISNSSYNEPEKSKFYIDTYKRIRKTNDLLGAFNKLQDEDVKGKADIYQGEALFFRALNYYRLLRDYGGVIIVDHSLKLDEEAILKGTRSTRTELAKFIIADLDKALTTKVGSLTDGADDGRITKEAVLALKARVALFEGTWEKYHKTAGGDANFFLDAAIDASNKIIASNKFELFDRRDILGKDSYYYFFVLETESQSNPAKLGKADQSEIILARKYSKSTVHRGNKLIGLSTPNLTPTKKIADMFLDINGLPIDHANTVFQGHGLSIDPATKKPVNREYADRDPRMNLLIPPLTQFFYHPPYDRDYSKSGDELIGTGFFMDGFLQGSTGYAFRKFIPETEGPFAHDYPVFRLAEILLINAEAIFAKNGAITNAELGKTINKLRARVGMPNLTNEFVASNNLSMIDEIRRERSIELYLEGFRYDDLRRWKTAETEMSKAIKGVKVDGSVWESSFEVYNPVTNKVQKVDLSSTNFTKDADGFIIVEEAAARTFKPKHYLKPLPLREILLNPNLEQNPGWVSQ